MPAASLLFFMASATGGFECGAIVEVESSAANAMARQGDGVVANCVSSPHLMEDRYRKAVY